MSFIDTPINYGTALLETEEQRKDREMAAKGYKPMVHNGAKSYWRMSDIPGPSAGDDGIYCTLCGHFYGGESRCPKHD